MKLACIISALLLLGLGPALGGIRAPSCDALVAFALGARLDPVEISFGKSADAMTLDDFEQAIDIVSVCIDVIGAGPKDIPGLTLRELKHTQLSALALLLEDLKLYRNRERERRAAQRKD
jgi:hypothetical protein